MEEKQAQKAQLPQFTESFQQESEQVRNEQQKNLSSKPIMPVVYYKWNEELTKEAQQLIQQDEQKLEENDYKKFEDNAHKQWNKFYNNHKLGFFHHRHYLDKEFYELVSCRLPQNLEKQLTFCELGCGVGDTVFPLKIMYPNIKFYACDFSQKAIDWVHQSKEYNPERVYAKVMDLVKDPFTNDFPSCDMVTLIFVLSAISPENHGLVIQKIYDWMKPGSVLYFRDYGRYDFSQLNFSTKKGRKLKENFYVKNDGTRVYYFSKEDISNLFQQSGFVEIENNVHYRYLENRKTGLQMYRVWLQGRFQKPGPKLFQYEMEEVKQIQEQLSKEKQQKLQYQIDEEKGQMKETYKEYQEKVLRQKRANWQKKKDEALNNLDAKKKEKEKHNPFDFEGIEDTLTSTYSEQ